MRRDDEIRAFQPQPFWELLTHYREVVFKFNGDRFTKEEAAGAVLDRVQGHAFKVQAVEKKEERELPPQLDLASESKETLALYGIDAKGNGLMNGVALLLARRLAQRGVRFIEVCHHGWDVHGGLTVSLPAATRQLDGPLAALLTDLKRLDMLKDTLVIVGGEFGRTSAAETRPKEPKYTPGRDHNCRGFTWLLAGGGVKPGFTYGATDELGFAAVENRCQIHDMYATFLHLLGMDHRRLTYRHAGRDFTLPDVHGDVLLDVVA